MNKNKKTSIISVQDISVTIASFDIDDYICITDMAKAKNGDARAADIIKNWIRNRSTLEFLGTWEKMYNPSFKVVEFDHFKMQAGLPTFVLSAKQWIEKTNAIGLYVQAGRYGGTYAHKDIAFEFGSAISPVFKLYLLKEYQRLKNLENDQQKLEWNAKRFLSKTNYLIHTDAIKKYVLPQSDYTKQTEWLAYADEADLLNVALFGCTAKQWRQANEEIAKKNNIRDFASINELTVLSNLETRNAEMIKEGKSKEERFRILLEIARYQISILDEADKMKVLNRGINNTDIMGAKMILNGKHIIYLDQNKWSDIMKSIDNPMYQGGKYLAVVQKIIEKSKKHEWIFPVSYTHFAETLIWKNANNSYKLGNTLDAISNKYTMPHFCEVLKDEILRIAQGKEMLKTYLIQGDPFAFTGGELLMTFEDYDGNRLPEVEKEFQEFFNHLNIYGTSAISDYFDRNEIEQNNKAIFKAMEHEKIWYLSLPEQNRALQYKLQSFKNLYAAMGLSVLNAEMITCDKKILSIIEQISSFDVHISLKINLYQNKEGRIDINDYKDILFLSVAIPYCDVVIAERTWINIAKSLNLNTKHNVILEKDLNYLIEL